MEDVKTDAAPSGAQVIQRLRDLSAEMRTIAMVAGQCSVEEPDSTEALMAAAEAERCAEWSNVVETIETQVSGLLARSTRQQEAIAALVEEWNTEANDSLRLWRFVHPRDVLKNCAAKVAALLPKQDTP